MQHFKLYGRACSVSSTVPETSGTQPYGSLTAAGMEHAGAAAHPQFTGGELGRGGEVHHIGTVGLQKAFVGQQRLATSEKGAPAAKGGHVLAAGKVEVDDVVGTLQIFDVREGQGPQPRRRRDRDDRAIPGSVARSSRAVSCSGRKEICRCLHRVHLESLVSVGGVRAKTRSAHPVLAAGPPPVSPPPGRKPSADEIQLVPGCRRAS